MDGTSDDRLRPSARGLLVDPDHRILLAEFELPSIHLWAVPGGGIEPGETSREALRRELLEEVGMVLDGDPPHVWRRRVVVADVVDGYEGVVEDHYLIRCEPFEPRGHLTDEELQAENVVAFRWWTIEEIRAATQAKAAYFSPRYLGDLLDDLLRTGPPAAPLDLGL